MGPTKTNPFFFNAFDSAVDSPVMAGTSANRCGTGRVAGSGANDQNSPSSPGPSRRSSTARALVIAASTFARLRTIEASAISRARSSSSNRATTSGSNPANAVRKPSRLRRIVSQDSPDWNASSVIRSNSACSPCTGRPHSVSW